MLVSYNWLKEYTKIELPPEELAEKLTRIGLEVVEIRSINPTINGLVIGEVMEKKKHPNADRLNLTKIRYLINGEETIAQVVCGAANIEATQKIFLATVGTELAPKFIIKKAKIRGEESCGMVCSKEELGKEENSEGIWVLPAEADLKDHPKKFLGNPDWILDFDLTSNRWDCSSVLGIAREVSCLTGNPLFLDNNKLPSLPPNLSANQTNQTNQPNQTNQFNLSWENLEEAVNYSVTINNPQKCYRYLGVEIRDITVKESPHWLQDRLFHHGLRPINNIVDITNLMIIEFGQPIHAFDGDKIGNKIIIRDGKLGEKLRLLDNKLIELNPNNLVIADEDKAIALAGVMGGLDSSVTSTSKNIFLEVASFSQETVQITAQEHQLNTDAARHYQHWVNNAFSLQVLKRAAALMAYLGQGKITYKWIDTFPCRGKEGDYSLSKKVSLNFEILDKTLGFKFPRNLIVEIFEKLFLKIVRDSLTTVEVEVPSHRQDIQYEWDLIEELARIFGYENIPKTFPKVSNGFGNLKKSLDRQTDTKITQIGKDCQALGFNEILTYPMVENNFAPIISLEEKDFLKPLNPFWNDISLLRNNLLFGFMKTITLNIEKRVMGFNKIFEIAKIFQPSVLQDLNQDSTKVKKLIPQLEHLHLGMALWNGEKEKFWKEDNRPYDFYDLSGSLENLFYRLLPHKFDKIKIIPSPQGMFTKQLSASIEIDRQVIGWIGQVSTKVMEYFDLDTSTNNQIFFAEIDLKKILNLINYSTQKYQPLSIYPAIHRDLALVVDKNYSLQEIIKDLPKLSPWIKKVTLNDIYEGEGIPQGKKSVVFNLELVSSEKTLERVEADEEVLKIVSKLKKKYDFSLR